MKLQQDFYTGDNVLEIAKRLLGKYIFTKIDGELTGAIITETEAYAGITDKASHAYGNKRTKRTEIMYAEGGVAYVYLCYGMHHLFNFVTNRKDIPDAILLRGILPVEGTGIIRERLGRKVSEGEIIEGPGRSAKALNISVKYNGTGLTGDIIWVEDKGIKIEEREIEKLARVGVGYAGEDALLPYRFRIGLKKIKIP